MEHPGIDMGPMGIFLSGDVKQQDLGCSKSKVAPFSSIQGTTLESLGESRCWFIVCSMSFPITCGAQRVKHSSHTFNYFQPCGFKASLTNRLILCMFKVHDCQMLHQAVNQAANQPLVLGFLRIHPSQSLMIRVEKAAAGTPQCALESSESKWMVFLRENPSKMDDLGVPLFQEIYIYIFIIIYTLK